MSEEVFDVAIVGASVSGSRTAELIAKKGDNVLLLEEHKKIGSPCQCTGLVSWRLRDLLPELPSKVVVNEVNKAKFFSPSGKPLSLQTKNPALVIDRPELDKFLFERAKKEGAVVRPGEKFTGLSYDKSTVKIKTDKRSYRSKIIIGADGFNSTVARLAGLEMAKNIFVGLQTTADGEFERDTVELWFGSKVAPKFFAWVVPESQTVARVGLASNPSSAKYYKKFLKKRIGQFVKPNVGGVIRTGLMKTTSAKRLMVVGDAAGQIKPHSGGGIIYGLMASRVCANAALIALKQNKFGEEFFRDVYDANWQHILANPIKRGLRLYKIISSPDTTLNFLLATARTFRKPLNSLDMDLINFLS